ncbi:PREDICTED: uncharacterized protein LOC108767163 [Trachymyrmex cornetzi]|uniref:uncharacterized protein LOC108767163 n=1 Tax=Trachymyrmex cornetzi TaxID=471704 RepID=UPI00084F6119|nr:PREDICTED: uncharacterized protein LOC108767163 [Trachymyrmex cornetzi]
MPDNTNHRRSNSIRGISTRVNRLPLNIKLADPEFHLPRSIDLLVGSVMSLSLFAIDQINLTREGYELYLQKTRLGWVVAGGASSQRATGLSICHSTNLESLVLQFWTIEEIATNRPLSEEESMCEAHFIRTVFRGDDGRYSVRLPFRDTNKRLGESRSVALKRLLALERKLNTNMTLKSDYTQVINEYLKLKYMSLVENPDEEGYYMPHHAVLKESSETTKVRVVFDASAKTSNGVSLNDLLMVGPTVQNNLFAHLIRFRTYNCVIIADIEKMYRQVALHEDDRRYQRILWRHNGKIEMFQLNTLTFGVSSSPFLAIRTLQQLADDESLVHPRASKIIKSHLYVDDLLTGAETFDQARVIRDEIIALLVRGGFTYPSMGIK